MPLYTGRDWRTRSNTPYKNLDEQRQDNEKNQRSANQKAMSGIIGVVAVGLVLLAESIPTDFVDSFDETRIVAILPTIAMILIAVFPFAAALTIYLILRVKRKQDASEAYDAQRTYARDERPQQSEDRYSAYTCTSRDYSEAVDSWDIKDPKPPWEL